MVPLRQTFVLATVSLVFLIPGYLCNDGKAFPLFNVVQFDNTVCTSSMAMSGMSSGTTTRNGTCYTESECQTRNGLPAGKCASGFGICCVFIVNSGAVTQNNTYLQNLGFSGPLMAATAVTYTVNKVEPDVCFLRLDFDTFNIMGPAGTIEMTGGTCDDTMTVTAPGANLPPICGSNTGQHMYIDIGKTAANTAMINFMFMAPAMGATMGMTSMRTWDIKVTQFKFSDPGNPPPGCLQYHSGMAGRIRTFNYDAMASTHIASQNYQVCIRQEPGYSCIQYSVCAGDTMGFTLDRATIAGAAVDTGCTSDFIEISGSSALCNQGTLTSRYCGTNLNTVPLAMADTPICDCTAPFRVGIFTDMTADTAVGTAPASKGVCLEYKQLP